jgi:outer membrane receptor protein involved in Fe transport
MERSTESVQLGGNASLSFRPSASHRLNLRGLYTNKADDEVLLYRGWDPDAGAFERRATRLTYVQREIRYATLEGQHDLGALARATVDWRFTRSDARRQQPDKRESMFIRVPIDESNPGWWGLATGRREYGDLLEDGWGSTIKLGMPYAFDGLGTGRVTVGFDRQSRRRDHHYRRFDFLPSQPGMDAPPESVYASVTEATTGRDNYAARQLVEAWFASVDLPLGRRFRGNLGVRREYGAQSVASHDLWAPAVVVAEGGARSTDWLTGANLTWLVSERMNLRAAASRTLNRPDLDDLSPLPALDFVGDKIRLGNPALERATIVNYDLRAELFPGGTEVFAAGVFYKRLHRPIEPALFGTNGQLGIRPENSQGGRNVGVELEARAGLGRLLPALHAWSVSSNLSLISSRIETDQATDRGNSEHPLVGQAPLLWNLGVTWAPGAWGSEVTLLSSTVGRRLKELNQTQVNAAGDGIPNLYTRAMTTLDLTAACSAFGRARIKLAASNLLDKPVQEFVGPIEMRRYATGRSFSVSLSLGS